MKRLVGFFIIAIAAVYLSVQGFKYYNSTHILSDQAAFEVYLNISENNIDGFFGLKKGTFDKKKQSIICQLPVTADGYIVKSVAVRSDMNHIDCNRTYNSEVDTKYDNSQLYGNNFRLFIIKGSFPAGLFDADLPITRGLIIVEKDVTATYSRGKINNIVITADSAYNYCSK